MPLQPSPTPQSRPPNSKSPWTLLERATPLEAKYLIKIILGDMRTGIKVSLVEEAIAAAYSAAIAEVRQARMLNGNLPEVLELAATGRLAEARMKLFHPLGFMLASPVETVEEALQRFSTEVAEEARDMPRDRLSKKPNWKISTMASGRRFTVARLSTRGGWRFSPVHGRI